MHAKGYVMPVEFQGKRCWKRLVIEDDLHEEIPTPEEILEVIERAKQKAKVEPRTSKKLVTMSMTMADDILRFLESALTEEDDYGKIAETRIRIHVKKMRRALSSSESELIDYIRLNVPSFRNPMSEFSKPYEAASEYQGT
jgi:transcription antitermination factor NusG